MRDPLDELIEDLERVVPEPATDVTDYSLLLNDLTYHASTILFPSDSRHPDHEQRVARVERWFKARAPQRAAQETTVQQESTTRANDVTCAASPKRKESAESADRPLADESS